MKTEAKPVGELTDEELFDCIREQVNASRNSRGHDRKRTKEISAEAHRRGWNLRQPNMNSE